MQIAGASAQEQPAELKANVEALQGEVQAAQAQMQEKLGNLDSDIAGLKDQLENMPAPVIPAEPESKVTPAEDAATTSPVYIT